MVMEEIKELVRLANVTRSSANINRRAIKMFEELGEVSEAWLNVTSSSNGKGKSWDDVREEIADCLIVTLDIAWTQLSLEDEHPGVSIPEWTPTDYNRFESVVFEIGYCISAFGNAINMQSELYHKLARAQIKRMLVLIVELVCIPLPDQQKLSAKKLQQQLLTEVKRKLAKWAINQANMTTVTDDV